LLAHGRWFSLGTPASSTTKAGRHDIAEILLKVALNTKNKKINQLFYCLIPKGGRKSFTLIVTYHMSPTFETLKMTKGSIYMCFIFTLQK
jgi:hypothetical protein